jgi:PAS domain S-box-containing protein
MESSRGKEARPGAGDRCSRSVDPGNQPVDSDRLLAIATRTARIGGWSVDLENDVIYWSDEVCRIHDEPPGTTVDIDRGIGYFPPEWRPVIREHFTRCAQEGIPYDMELEILSRAGRRVWVRSIGEPVRDPAGKIVAVQGAFQDISSRKAAEAEMRGLEARLARTLESMSDAFFTLDREWRFTFLNSEAERVLERSREELLGQVVWDEFPEAVGLDFFRQYRRAMEENRVVRFEEYFPPLQRWFRVRAHPSEEGLAVHFEDVTQEREAREAARFRSELLRRVGQPVVAVDADDRVTYWNQATEALLGWKASEMEGNTVLEKIVQEGDWEKAREARRSVEAGEEWSGELRLRRRDGSEAIVQASVSPIADRDGRQSGRIIVAADITEQKRTEEVLRHAQKLEAVGRLSGGVAHDFNNLLTVIQGSAQMLHSELGGGSGLRKYAEEILREAHRATRLTRQLLAFSRRQVLDERIVDLGREVRELMPALRRMIPTRIDLDYQERATGLQVRVDPDQLRHVLLNLTVNAADAIEGQGRIGIRVEPLELSDEDPGPQAEKLAPGSYVGISVEDTGTGITPEVMEQLFEPFFTTKPEGKGTGLGLPMVYGIVKQSGGDLRVRSEPGEGSTFQVLLPRVDGAAEDPPAEGADAVSAAGPERGSGTVLVVEDDPGVRRVVARMLDQAGYGVLEAGGGEEALRIVTSAEEPIDIVVSDIVMPIMDGLELLTRLRGHRSDLPVVLMSGYSEQELGVNARRRASAFLQKPFTPRQLGDAVRNAIGS